MKILELHVPRNMVDEVAPESSLPVVTIDPVHDARLVGSLENISPDDVDYHVRRLMESGYKWIVLQNEFLAEILYADELTEQVSSAARLRARDLAFEEPPLSLTELSKLGMDSGQMARI